MAIEKINKAMETADKREIFQALQSKDAKLPFLYSDRSDKYLAALAEERLVECRGMSWLAVSVPFHLVSVPFRPISIPFHQLFNNTHFQYVDILVCL